VQYQKLRFKNILTFEYRTEGATQGVGQELEEEDSYEIIIETPIAYKDKEGSSTEDFSTELRKRHKDSPNIGPNLQNSSTMRIPYKH
jgi:hypothetical protein